MGLTALDAHIATEAQRLAMYRRRLYNLTTEHGIDAAELNAWVATTQATIDDLLDLRLAGEAAPSLSQVLQKPPLKR